MMVPYQQYIRPIFVVATVADEDIAFAIVYIGGDFHPWAWVIVMPSLVR